LPIPAEPVTKTKVPKAISVAGKRFELVGQGIRQVTFLYVSVYTAGIYVNDALKKRIQSSSRWRQEYSADKLIKGEGEAKWFARDLVDGRNGSEISLRIDPVRNTDGPHLRNGFVRFLTARLRQEEAGMSETERASFADALDAFRSLFPAGVVRPGQALVFTRLSDGRLRGEFNGAETGIVANAALSQWVMEGYLHSQPAAISPFLVSSVAQGLERLARSG
ncbi:chalcone isomerase, partial [Entophlyctis helioformis]